MQELENFSPTKAELTKLAADSHNLDLTDPFDQAQYKRVKEAKMTLVHVRNDIAKLGKKLRDDANAYAKAVITKEKELTAIIAPEEERLADMLAAADRAIEREERKELLPHRKQRLAAIGDGVFVPDDSLLDMDGPEFESYVNIRVADKNEADRRKIEADQKKIDDEKAELARKQELADAEERGKKQEAERLEREAKEREEREQREKEDAERREHEEQERLEKESRYKHFLSDNGYTQSNKHTFHIERNGDDVRLYRLVGILTLK